MQRLRPDIAPGRRKGAAASSPPIWEAGAAIQMRLPGGKEARPYTGAAKAQLPPACRGAAGAAALFSC